MFLICLCHQFRFKLCHNPGAVNPPSPIPQNLITNQTSVAGQIILNHLTLLNSKGKGKATYYVPGNKLTTPAPDLNTPASGLSTPPPGLSTPPPGLNTPPPGLSTQPPGLSTLPFDSLNTPPQDLSTPPQDLSTPPQKILERIGALNKREHDKSKVEAIIMDLCSLKALKASEIAAYFQKEESYFKRKYLSSMIAEKKLKYLYREMINHPEQAYLTNKKD